MTVSWGNLLLLFSFFASFGTERCMSGPYISERIRLPPVPEPNNPPRANLVWAPENELEELEGYGAYLKFANSRGLHHHHDGRFKTGDTEVGRNCRSYDGPAF
jgi:hypothetical protein